MLGYPLCFESKKQYEAWKALRKEAPVPEQHGHCWDCTPQFAAEMRAAGRCMHPETKFAIVFDIDDIDLDGTLPRMIVGVRPEPPADGQ